MNKQELDNEMWTYDSNKNIFNYTGINNKDIIMTVHVNIDGDLTIDNRTDCTDIWIPKFVIEKLYSIG